MWEAVGDGSGAAEFVVREECRKASSLRRRTEEQPRPRPPRGRTTVKQPFGISPEEGRDRVRRSRKRRRQFKTGSVILSGRFVGSEEEEQEDEEEGVGMRYLLSLCLG